MAPRAYRLHQRATSAAATRARILESTIEIYRERGIPATTLKAVAERADVSRGTILHHFGSAQGLLGAVLDVVLDSLEFPDANTLRGIDDFDTRIREFVEGMIDFQARTSHWWPIFEADMARPELQAREAKYWAILADLQAATLGPELSEDKRANAVLVSSVHPATVGTFFWAFEQAGLGRDEVRPLLGDLAVDAVRRVTDRSKGKAGSA